MKPGFICVAGVDRQTGKHVRPFQSSRLRSEMLVRNGGPFDIGSEVDLGHVTSRGHAPELEDHFFDPKAVRRLGDILPDRFWRTLNNIVSTRLVNIFGNDLQQRGNTCTVDLGKGSGSLGCLLPSERPILYVTGFGKIRLCVSDGQFSVDLSVTDLRLYEDDYQTPRYDAVKSVAGRIERGVSVIVGVGLTQPWKKPDDTESRHWLQANSIHLEDEPIWRLG